jgi:hypothetical protein
VIMFIVVSVIMICPLNCMYEHLIVQSSKLKFSFSLQYCDVVKVAIFHWNI